MVHWCGHAEDWIDSECETLGVELRERAGPLARRGIAKNAILPIDFGVARRRLDQRLAIRAGRSCKAKYEVVSNMLED
jgi:hypothetical protein